MKEGDISPALGRHRRRAVHARRAASCGHHARGLPLERIASLLAAAPARRFGLARKGALAVGDDADLALVALDEPYTLEACRPAAAAQDEPVPGRARFAARVRRTIRRGETIFARRPHHRAALQAASCGQPE